MAKQLIPGDIYGFWKVESLESQRYAFCICIGCKASTKRRIRKWTLLRGESKSCGCQMKKIMRETNQNKYGVDFVQQNTLVKNKSKHTLNEKYGVDNAMKDEKIKKRAQLTKLIKKARKEGGMVLGIDLLGEDKS